MPQTGYARSPFQEGFSFLREEPLLLPAELCWRWCFALAAWLVALLAAALFLDSLRVSAFDRFLLGTLNPMLQTSAVSHIFRGTLLRYLWIKFVVLTGLTILWALAAAVGRSASLRNIVALAGSDDRDVDAGWQLRPMFQLHLLRALWNWIALGCFSVSFVLGQVMRQQGHAARAAFFYVFAVALSFFFGVVLNWVFGLAPLFCIRSQIEAREALSLTLDFCTRQGGRLCGLSLAFLALRLVWAASMFLIVMAPTELGKRIALGWIPLMMFALFLIYLAGADALLLARLGAYATLADIDSRPSPEPEPVAPPAPPLQSWTPHIPPTDTPHSHPA